MKTSRIVFALLTVSVLAACSSDVTAPSNAKPSTPNSNVGTIGGTP